MKSIWLCVAALFVSGVVAFISGIWSIVSFIIYLVKDIPFEWWVLWVCIITTVFFYGFTILVAIMRAKQALDEDKLIREFNDKRFGGKSPFRSRLDQAMADLENSKKDILK